MPGVSRTVEANHMPGNVFVVISEQDHIPSSTTLRSNPIDVFEMRLNACCS